MRNGVVKSLTKVECYSDGLMFVEISAKSVDLVLVQVYMPTTNHDDDEIENCMKRSVRHCTKKEEVK